VGNKQIRSYREFWPFYVSQHLNRTNRWLHFVGTTCVLILTCLFLTRIVSLLFVPNAPFDYLPFWIGHVLCVPLAGYAFAWSGHAFFEKNKPATFTYPLMSLMGDFQMYWYMWQGKMDGEVKNVRTQMAAQATEAFKKA